MSKMGSRTAGRRARRQFSEEFRIGAVRLVLDAGKTVGAVARELDLTPSALAQWVKQARADRTKGKTGLTTEERAELARLRKDNRELRMERDVRPGLDSCVRALRTGDVLVVWKLDRLGRNLAHLVNTVQTLSARGVGLRVLAGQGTQIDTTTAAGRLVFGIFAALAEFERKLIRERTLAGLTAARARGRNGGRTFALSKAQVRLA